MNDKQLKNLNFNELLHYPQKFKVENRYKTLIDCNNFCKECEKHLPKQIIKPKSIYISHACMTDDYEKILGKLQKKSNNIRVMILFENPSKNSDYDLGDWRPQKGKLQKYIPLKHYYWTLDPDWNKINKWPISLKEIIDYRSKTGEGYYGIYLAYIIKKYNLHRCYITNLIKCKNLNFQRYDENYMLQLDKCINKFLKREIEIFKPTHIIYMGKVVEKLMKKVIDPKSVKTCCLHHPSAISSRSQAYHKTQIQMFKENDEKLNELFGLFL